MAETETGWTDEFPQVEEAFYWARHKLIPETAHAAQLRDGSLYFTDGTSISRSHRKDCEFLGPISPSDFEQLRGLRDWKESAMALLSRYDSIAETFGGKLGSSKIDNLERGVERLRRALNGLKQRHGCWCELPPNVGSPDHTIQCDRAREALAQRNTGGK